MPGPAVQSDLRHHLTMPSILQSDKGAVNLAGTDATLPNPTTEGNTVLIFAAGNGVAVDPISGFEKHDQTGATFPISLFSRVDVPAGESSWPMTQTPAGTFLWVAAEVDMLDTSPFVTVVNNSGTGSGLTLSAGTTSAFSEPDTICFACFGMYAANRHGTVWTGYSNGYTQLEQATIALTTDDAIFAVAWNTANATAQESTATRSDGGASDTMQASLIVYRAAVVEQATSGIIAVSGG